MSTFSVRKPFTVFVAVVLIIILGIVSFSNMVPDLMPKIEMQYAVILTAFPGASPQEVEEQVTKPIEGSLATLENLKNYSSTSAENFSMVMLEFSDSVNMDTLSVDIREKLNLINFKSDLITTPTIMKLNPDVLPVNVSAVAFEGLSGVELSTFISDKILPELEGVEGVAAVTASGLVNAFVNIDVDTAKLDQVNRELAAAIDNLFNSGRSQILSGISKAESGSGALSASVTALKGAQTELTKQIEDSRRELDDSRTKLLEGKLEITRQLTTATENLEKVRASRLGLQQLSDSAAQLKAARQAMIDALVSTGMTEEQALAELAGNADFIKINTALAAIEAQLAALGYTLDTLPAALLALAENEAKLAGAVAALEATLNDLNNNQITLEQAMGELSAAEASGNFEIYKKLIDVTNGQNSIDATISDLKKALADLDAQSAEMKDKTDLRSILTVDMISKVLSAQNFSMPAGYLNDGANQYLITVGDRLADINSIKGLVLFDAGISGMEPIYLADVANIYTSDNAAASYAKINGKDGVLLSFTKQSGYATAVVSQNIQKRFAELNAEYSGMSNVSLMDQGDYIEILVDSVMNNLVIGAVLAILILMLFLRDIRPTLITAISIPISVTFAIVLMYFSGVTLNVISLSGLAVGVGMLVDNSIVCIENIYRLRSRGYSPVRSAISGAGQIAGAIVSSTLTTVCVFFPIVFVHGLTRQLFTDMALTISYSLLASLFVALTVVPALSLPVLRREIKAENKSYEKMLGVYSRALGKALGKKALVLILCLVLLVTSLAWSISRGFTFMPEMSAMQISVQLEFPIDADSEHINAEADAIAEKIGRLSGVETVGAMYSSGMMDMMGMGSAGGSNKMTMYVLTDGSVPDRETAAGIKDICADYSCEAVVNSSGGMSNYASVLGGNGVGIKLYANDLDVLERAAKEVSAILAGVEGIDVVDDGLGEPAPAVKVTVDKSAAMKYNLTVAQVYMKISEALKTTSQSTTVKDENNNSFTIEVKSEIGAVTSLEELKSFTFEVENVAGESQRVALADIADISVGTALRSIARENGRRTVNINGTLKEGYNVTLVTESARKAIEANYKAPAGVTVKFSGENEAIMDAMSDLMLMLLLGIIIVYLIMVAQFQSFMSPFIVMFTIPLSFTGGLLALCLSGMEISVIALIGFVMLVGVIVNNGIVLVDRINQLRLEGHELNEAIVTACTTRLRPVLMTALTTILGLAPMALGFGMGAEMIQPVAIVCVGGLIYATLMTLFVVPVVYSALMKRPLYKVTEEDMSIITE